MKHKSIYLLGVMFLLLSMILAACAPAATEAPTEAPAEPTEAPAEPTEEPMPEAPGTIVDIAVADGRFTTLVTALQAAELVETLQGEGPFTVFAPTDDAFAALGDTVNTLLLPENKQQLTDILLYHVVPGKVMAADVVGLDGQMVDTALAGQQIGITVDMEKVYLNENVQVIITDIEASNGVIHVIDAVLLPPTEAPEAMEGQPLWNKELRQAIAAAIDREVIVDRVFEGRNIPAYHMVPQGYPYATEPFLDKYGTRDLDMAIQLLTDLGYTTDAPFSFELWYPPEHYGTTTADVMQVIKEQLEETGLIQVELKSQNWAEYVDSFVAGELPFFILGWFPDFVDPDTWLSPFASCTQSPDQGVNYCNEEMDALLLQAGSSADPAAREEAYRQVGELFAEEVPTLPLFFEPEFITSRTGVEGIAIGAPFEFMYPVLSFGEGAVPASGSTDTIIIGTTDEVNSLDPTDAYATHDWEILKNTGVPLLKYVPGTADLVPGAAVDLPTVSEDGLTYTFTLREGITYADGTPVTAQDYVRLWNRLNTLEGQVSGLIQVYVADIQAPDDQTVVVTLNASYGFFPALAATAPFIPANPNIFPDDQIVQFPATVDGIGPYRMVSYTPGEQMVLEANPTYFGDDKPIIPNVIIRYYADPTTMSQAVEKGEIDIAWRILGAVEAARLQNVEGLTVTKINAPALRYMVFNHTYMVGGEE